MIKQVKPSQVTGIKKSNVYGKRNDQLKTENGEFKSAKENEIIESGFECSFNKKKMMVLGRKWIFLFSISIMLMICVCVCVYFYFLR